MEGGSGEFSEDFGEPTSWSPDGQYLLVQWNNGATNRDVMVLSAAPGVAAKPFVASVADELQGQFSPDGRWVAYASRADDRYDVYVTDFPARQHTLQVSTAGWRPTALARRWP